MHPNSRQIAVQSSLELTANMVGQWAATTQFGFDLFRNSRIGLRWIGGFFGELHGFGDHSLFGGASLKLKVMLFFGNKALDSGKIRILRSDGTE